MNLNSQLPARGFTVAYELRLPELHTLSFTAAKKISDNWQTLLSILPEGCLIHKLDSFKRKSFSMPAPASTPSLETDQLKMFSDRRFMSHRCFLFIRTWLNRPYQVDSFSEQILPYLSELEPVKLGYVQNDMELLSLVPPDAFCFHRSLSQVQYSTESLNDFTVYSLLQPDVSLSDQLSFVRQTPTTSAYGFKEKVDFTASSTQLLHQDCASMTTLLPVDHIYSQYLMIPYRDHVKETVHKKYRNASLKKQLFKGYFYTDEVAMLPVLTEIQNDFANDVSYVQFQATLILMNSDSFLRTYQRDIVEKALEEWGLNADLVVNESLKRTLLSAALPGYASTLPADQFPVITSSFACKLFNVETFNSWPESANGIWLSDRLTGRPCHIDLSEAPYKRGYVRNRNKLILGTNDSDRTEFMNQLISSYCGRLDPCFATQRPNSLVVIEAGNSYSTLCAYVGGTHLTIDSDTCFNPFFDLATNRLGCVYFVGQLIRKLWRGNVPILRTEASMLDKLLMAYSQALQNNLFQPSLNTFYEFINQQGSVLLEPFMSNPACRVEQFLAELLHALQLYYKGGIYDRFLNSPTPFALPDSSLLVISVEALSNQERLLTPAVELITRLIVNKMAHNHSQSRYIVAIETNRLLPALRLDDETFLYFLSQIRTYAAELWLNTSDLRMFLNNDPLGSIFIEQFDTKIVLDVNSNPDQLAKLCTVLGLPAPAKHLIDSLHRREVFISFANHQSSVFRLETTSAQRMIYMPTKSMKTAFLDISTKQKQSLSQTLQQLVKEGSSGDLL